MNASGTLRFRLWMGIPQSETGKAFFAGRRGIPVLQLYYDLAKLFRKGAVYSETSSWVLRASPVVALAGVSVALFMIPLGALSAPLAFQFEIDALSEKVKGFKPNLLGKPKYEFISLD